MTSKTTPGPLGARVAQEVRRHREAGRLAYAELARRLADTGRPIPVLGLRRIESGERRVDVDDLAALAHVFGVEPWTLTQTAQCESCLDAPPSGFRCLTCGAER